MDKVDTDLFKMTIGVTSMSDIPEFKQEKAPEFKIGYSGLKKLRRGRERSPKYHCENCKCNRYNPCGCTKK